MDNCASNKTSDIVSAIQVLHGVNSQELSRLLRDSDNFIIQLQAENGPSILIDMEKTASSLPLHLIAVLLSTDIHKNMEHLLRGLRVLHIFSDLATRHARLEQILLDDVKLSEQVMDLVFFTLIILARHKQDNHLGAAPLLHSTIVACSLHLLTGFLSSQWHELAYVLLAHPKVDIFIDVAFDSLHEDVKILDGNLRALKNEEVLLDVSTVPAAQRIIHYICQQCEASMQFLLSLCQQKLFRDRVLRNKELCKQGGILSLALTVLQLSVPTLGCFKEPSDIAASVSRLKAKILSILLQLCEAESISYLDEVAGSPKSMHFAKSVALQFLELLRASLRREDNKPCDSQDRIPTGLVLLNTLRLADIFSDDSNFRSFFMINSVPVLAAILEVPHEEFSSTWCSSKIAIVEEDANLEYDSFTAAGVTLASLNGIVDNDKSIPVRLNETTSACPLNIINLPSANYAQQRTSCLVKIIANLHVFVPNICEEQERDMFLNQFFNYLFLEIKEPLAHQSSSILQKISTVCRNLSSLSQYAKSLIPNFLNDEDVQLVSVYADKLQKSTHARVGDSSAKDRHEVGISSYTLKKPEESSVDTPNLASNSGDLKIEPKDISVPCTSTKLNGSVDSEKEVENSQTKGVDICSSKMDIEGTPEGNERLKPEPPAKESEHEMQDSGQNEEKQPRKRKRNIMNELQVNLIEKALVDEPEMQKNAPSLQSWADKLSAQGSEITSSQLKNWLNNRKARLARAAKEARAPSEGETSVPDKSSGPINFYDSPESASEENYAPPTRGSNHQAVTKSGGMITRSASCEDPEMVTPTDLARRNRQNGSSNRSASFEPGQIILLVNEGGKSVAKGKIFQIEGSWHGRSLEGVTCVVDVIELKVDRSTEVQHPSEVAGRTFEESAAKNGGVMRVAWDNSAIYPIP